MFPAHTAHHSNFSLCNLEKIPDVKQACGKILVQASGIIGGY